MDVIVIDHLVFSLYRKTMSITEVTDIFFKAQL